MGAERGAVLYADRSSYKLAESHGCKLNFRMPIFFTSFGRVFVGSLETLAHLTYAFAYCQVLVINSCICLAKVASQPRVHTVQ